jgi:DNA-directed RNA polymerase specialized sigma24 family protein
MNDEAWGRAFAAAYRFARSKGCGEADAEDLAQDSLMRLLDPKRPRRVDQPLDWQAGVTAERERAARQDARREAIRALLRGLARQVFELYEAGTVAVADIVRITGASTAAVYEARRAVAAAAAAVPQDEGSGPDIVAASDAYDDRDEEVAS